MGVVVSSSHVSAVPSSSGGGLLTLLPCFSIGTPPMGGAMNIHDFLRPESYPQGAILHEMSSVIPTWGHKSFQEPSLAWVSHKVAAFFRHPPPLPWSPPQAAREQPVSPWSSLWAAEKSQPWSASSRPFTDLGGCSFLSLVCCLPLSLAVIASKQFFFPTLLRLLSQGHCRSHWWGWLGHLGASWHWLCRS